MSELYRDFLSSMSGAAGIAPTTPEEMQAIGLPGAQMGLNPAHLAGQYQNPGYFSGLQDPSAQSSAKGPSKSRRKSLAGLAGETAAVKHRRTRSGCFVCRNRRVKCDETRPVCDRCKKGNRDCVYPDPPEPKASQGSKLKDAKSAQQQASPLSSVEGQDDEGEQESARAPVTALDETEETAAKPHMMTAYNVQNLGAADSASSGDGNKSSSPSASTVTSTSLSNYTANDLSTTAGSPLDWSFLPAEMQGHLHWFRDNMTNFHYCITNDFDDFFKSILPSIASRSEPLLNALVGFSAYNSTLRNPKGKLEDFLQYYNKSVILLLQALKKKEKHSIGTLLTILQLATIEEYLGDWVNLMGHQKAAFEIITKIFTPQTVMQSPTGRMCLTWYIRFDNFVALMGGFPTDLPREWFSNVVSYHQAQGAANPEALRWKMDERTARLRVITYDMSILFARGSRGQIATEAFNTAHDQLTRRLEEWKNTWDPAVTDPRYLVTEFPHKRPTDPDDIVDPYSPEILYDFPYFGSTVIMAEWHSIMIMHKCQSSNTPQPQLFMSLQTHAYATCQYFETLEYWPSTPNGTMVTVQACIAIAALFLPQNAQHHSWFRRKFAFLETLGYIHPLSLRMKMAEVFREPSCVRWWLSDDDGFSPILQSIRNFADERNAAAMNAQQESLREVQHIFAKMSMDG